MVNYARNSAVRPPLLIRVGIALIGPMGHLVTSVAERYILPVCEPLPGRGLVSLNIWPGSSSLCLSAQDRQSHSIANRSTDNAEEIDWRQKNVQI